MVAPELFGVCEQGGLAPENEFEVRISNTFKKCERVLGLNPSLLTACPLPFLLNCHPPTPVIKLRVSYSFFFCYAAKTDLGVSDRVTN